MTSTDIVKWRKTNDYENFEKGMIYMKILKKGGGSREKGGGGNEIHASCACGYTLKHDVNRCFWNSARSKCKHVYKPVVSFINKTGLSVGKYHWS